MAMTLRIVIDRKIYLAQEAFATLGEVLPLDGSRIDAQSVKDADLLITRTTTKVDESLLCNARVRFVATATAGTDHIDLDYLSRAGIAFTSAAGCNATAVAEYVINALVCLLTRRSLELKGKTLGIVGVGHAGSALKRKAECLGLRCLLNDPPIFDRTGNARYIPLPDLLRRSDIVSLHVPRIMDGLYKTHHLLNQRTLTTLKRGAVLINTSRGGVIDESGLAQVKHMLGGLILDVWENEPSIDTSILAMTDIATPHVAGYSLDGKIKATETVYRKACEFLECECRWQSPRGRRSGRQTIDLINSTTPLKHTLSTVYDVYHDDTALRRITREEDPESYFRSLRNSYRYRDAFSNFRLINTRYLSASQRAQLDCLGFMLED